MKKEKCLKEKMLRRNKNESVNLKQSVFKLLTFNTNISKTLVFEMVNLI